MSTTAFERIASEATKAAANVPCSVANYVVGLELIVAELEMALDAARDDLRREGGDE